MNASWPQTKTIWSICVKVKEAAYLGPAVDSQEWKRLADEGTLTREKASNIIHQFISKDRNRFWDAVHEFDGSFKMDTAKFDAARRWAPKGKYKSTPPKPIPPGKIYKDYGGHELELGDMVVHLGTGAYPRLEGAKGKVCGLGGGMDVQSVGVEFEKPISSYSRDHSGHSCDGHCEESHGWYISPECLGKIFEEKEGKEEQTQEDPPPPPDEDEFSKKLRELEEAHRKAQEQAKKMRERESFKPESIEYVKPDIFDDVCTMIKGGVQVCLVGPSGCGKSLLITEIAKVLGRGLYVESFAGGKRYSQVFGSTHLVDGKSEWVAAKFIQELQKDNMIIFMDEVMSADPDVLIGANPILDRKTRGFHSPVGVINVNPSCTICAASNVTGREYSMNYKGTQQQDASVLNRFVHVHMSYDPRVEKTIVKKSPIEEADKKYLLDHLKALRQLISANNIAYDPSTRKLVQAIELNVLGLPMPKAFEYSFLTPLSLVERKKLEL
jgi:MoxR-like ATPase